MKKNFIKIAAFLSTAAMSVSYLAVVNASAASGLLYGDANCDGKVTVADAIAVESYLKGEFSLTEQGLINADANRDGMISMPDAKLIREWLDEDTGSGNNDTPAEEEVFLIGDANCDRKVTVADAIAIESYLKGEFSLTEQGLINADVNRDGVVSQIDAKLIRE